MELGPMEFALVAIAAVSLLAVAFALAWIDAAPRKRRDLKD